MTHSVPGTVGTQDTRLIVVRGNSASGKSSVAAGLRERFGRSLAIVGQDNLRRTVLRERDRPGAANIGIIDLTARYALDNGFHVVVEGILYADRYGTMLQNLVRTSPRQKCCQSIPEDGIAPIGISDAQASALVRERKREQRPVSGACRTDRSLQSSRPSVPCIPDAQAGEARTVWTARAAVPPRSGPCPRRVQGRPRARTVQPASRQVSALRVPRPSMTFGLAVRAAVTTTGSWRMGRRGAQVADVCGFLVGEFAER